MVMAMKTTKVVDNPEKIDILSIMKNKDTSADTIPVMTKYVKAGKETAYYQLSTGKCWIDKTINGETTTKVTYSPNKK